MDNSSFDVIDFRNKLDACMEHLNSSDPDIRTRELKVMIDFTESEIARFPNSSTLYCMLGNLIAMESGTAGILSDKRLDAYKRALHVDPLCVQAHESLGYWYLLNGESSLAIHCFEKAILIKENVESYIGLAEAYGEVSDLDGQNTAFEWAKELAKAKLRKAVVARKEAITDRSNLE